MTTTRSGAQIAGGQAMSGQTDEAEHSNDDDDGADDIDDLIHGFVSFSRSIRSVPLAADAVERSAPASLAALSLRRAMAL